MTPYLPYVFGIVSLLSGVYLFLIAFKIYSPTPKSEEDKVKMDNWHKKFGKAMKVISILLILNGAYNLINSDPDQYNINPQEKTEWGEDDKKLLVDNCIIGAKSTAAKYPEMIKVYCICSTNKIVSAISYTKYTESLKMPEEDQLKLILPLIQDCTDEFDKEVKKRQQ